MGGVPPDHLWLLEDGGVPTPGDTTDPNDGQLTLREAVALANRQPDARIAAAS